MMSDVEFLIKKVDTGREHPAAYAILIMAAGNVLESYMACHLRIPGHVE